MTPRGRVRCWGSNAYLQAGAAPGVAIWNPDDAQRNATDYALSEPFDLDGLSPARQVAIGARHTCAATHSGEVYCWGNNPNGLLGFDSDTTCYTGVPTSRCALQPARVQLVGDATSIAAADSPLPYTCAVEHQRSLSCWGNAGFGGDSTQNGAFKAVELNASESPSSRTQSEHVECPSKAAPPPREVVHACTATPRALPLCEPDVLKGAVPVSHLARASGNTNKAEPDDGTTIIRGVLGAYRWAIKEELGQVHTELALSGNVANERGSNGVSGSAALALSTAAPTQNVFECPEPTDPSKTARERCCRYVTGTEVVATGHVTETSYGAGAVGRPPLTLQVRRLCQVE